MRSLEATNYHLLSGYPTVWHGYCLMVVDQLTYAFMNDTLFLFQEEDLDRKDYDVLLSLLKNTARNAQFLHCLLRSVRKNNLKPVSAILRALQELETIGKGVYTSIEEISSINSLKKLNKEKGLFLSDISDDDVVIAPDLSRTKKVSKDMYYRMLAAKAHLYRVHGSSNVRDIRDKEPEILAKFEEFNYKVGEITRYCNDL